MAVQGEQVAHADLVGGGEISLHSHAGGGGLDPANYWGKNLVAYSPGQVPVDGAEPQGWDSSANCTFTDEDAVGEGIPDITEWVFKGVTTQPDEYGYRTLTFADESLLDAGQTVVSVSVKVYCTAASKASIGIYGANLGLQESTQHLGGSTWETLTVEAKTLHGSDTSVELRCIVDTGTAYFTMPMLTVGPEARPWEPRDTGFVVCPRATVLDLTATTDVAWSDLDVTGQTHNLCVAVLLDLLAYETDGTPGSNIAVGHSDDITGVDTDISALAVLVPGVKWHRGGCVGPVFVNDSQQFRYTISETDNDSDMDVRINIIGYWRWV